MSSSARRARRSDPGQQSDAGSPRIMKQRGGWEYPMSREEKKHRLMCLFQAELADAERSRADNEALQMLMEKRHNTPNSPRKMPTGSGVAEGSSLSAQTVSRARMEGCGLGMVALMGVFIAIWLQHTPASVRSDAVAVVLDTPAVPPNISDRVLGMREEGHKRLKLSNCAEAEWWFSRAYDLISDAGNVSDLDHNHSVNHIVGERGFAFVCSQRYKDGAKHLEQHLLDIDLPRAAPHLLNALGYAYFYMEDFNKASNFFEVGIKVEEDNPVLWNNYAAAKIVANDLPAANGALIYAVESIKKLRIHQDHHADLVAYNLHVLKERQQDKGEKLLSPWVDLWNGYA